MPTDEEIIREAKDRFAICEEWEARARLWFDYDYKFANGDDHNMYQWDTAIAQRRGLEDKPCLTINKTQQHNLMIINDAKQNKPGVNVRPVGDTASYDAAQVFQQVIRHIEYISNAEQAYDNATMFQVQAGIGYWRLTTDYLTSTSFDQEIFIKPIKDPRSVYLDPDINEADGSDARFGFIFDDLPKDLYDDKYPEFTDLGWSSSFNTVPDTWLTKNTVRVAEYLRKTQKPDRYVAFTNPDTGEQVIDYFSKLEPAMKEMFTAIKKRENNLPNELKTHKERKILTDNVEWYKIAGNRIIDRGPWLGKYIPIVRVVGTETIIDGILDRKGHTRALISAQRIYNYNTSANVEYGALQTKSPWIAAADAISGLEEYWSTANTKNHSFLPYNHVDDNGNDIPPPSRPAAPQASPAYVQQMQIAQNEMMMVSGQYQAQMGENENAKSGVAINARQRQGDRATYHFIDNQAVAVRYTGKQLIDLIPKVYDTKRVHRISADDGSILNVTIDPEAEQAYQKLPPQAGQTMDKSQQIIEIIFNPTIGTYDVQSEVGPSFATKRQEAFNALTQIAAENKDFMNIAGDVLWKVADFPEAQILVERWRKVIPPNILGDAPDPQTEQAMKQAADKIEQLLSVITKQTSDLVNRDKELDIRHYEAETARKTAEVNASRLDYEAETKRLVAAGNSGPGVAVEQVQPVIKQLVRGMLNAGEPGSGDDIHLPGPHEGGTLVSNLESENDDNTEQPTNGAEEPPVEGARKAPDGDWYVPDPNRSGKFLMVNNNAVQ